MVGKADKFAPCIPQAGGHLADRPDANHQCWLGGCGEEMVASRRPASNLNVNLRVGQAALTHKLVYQERKLSSWLGQRQLYARGAAFQTGKMRVDGEGPSPVGADDLVDAVSEVEAPVLQ